MKYRSKWSLISEDYEFIGLIVFKKKYWSKGSLRILYPYLRALKLTGPSSSCQKHLQLRLLSVRHPAKTSKSEHDLGVDYSCIIISAFRRPRGKQHLFRFSFFKIALPTRIKLTWWRATFHIKWSTSTTMSIESIQKRSKGTATGFIPLIQMSPSRVIRFRRWSQAILVFFINKICKKE